MNDTVLQLDPSLERAIMDERLDGRRSLFDDMRTGFHARLVIAATEHARTSRREAHPMPGDLDIREYARMSAHEFHALHSGQITAEGHNDDTEDFYLRRDTSKRVHHVPRKTVVFIGSKYGPPSA